MIEEAGYTNAYIKANDLDKLNHYFEKEFIPGLLLKDDASVAELTREEIAKFYEDYQTHIKRMK